MNLVEHQKQSLKAMVLLDDILKRNNIDYFLLAGSALGAVRHKGMIPWDDDIDVGVKYEDIDKLENILLKEPLGDFRYISINNDPTYPRLHAKILYNGHCCIDIFPLVKVSDNKYVRKMQWIIRKITWKIYSRKVGYRHKDEKGLWVFVSRILALLLSKKMVLHISDLNCRAFLKRKTKYYINMFSIYSMNKELIPTKCVENPQQIEFDGETFTTLGYLDEYLTNLYGDYMTPVPPKDRVSTHVETF